MILNEFFNLPQVFEKDATGKSPVNEFAPTGGDDDSGPDPYGAPRPEHYDRSIDFFGQFEADHFDREDMDDATGVFKGYWGADQIAYFKFDNPSRTGSDDPGTGWYYEPVDEGVAETAGNIGSKIKALYQKIYTAGDDAIEFVYNDSPIFAQYWDEYEGDLDSIIAEVDPRELQVIAAELESAVEDQGLAEGEDFYTVANDPQKPGMHSYQEVGHALQSGHADTAKIYKNNKFLGTVGDVRKQGVAETRVGNRMSDMSVGSPKIVFKDGRAVGEIGLDHDPSPGQGPYYMKHYETNTWYSGYDTKKEALADLKHVVSQMNEQGMAEGLSDVVKGVKRAVKGKTDPTVAVAHRSNEFIKAVNTGDKDAIKKTERNLDRVNKVTHGKISEQGVAEAKSDDYVPPKEADYGPEYQAMVQRVGQKARAQEKAKQQQQKQPSKTPVKESRRDLLKRIIQS